MTASILPLQVDGLGFDAGGRRLLGEVSLTLPAGGMVALLGPNGAGKSLLLRLIHGLLVPTRGRIVWQNGGRVAGVKRHAWLPQVPVMLRRSVSACLHHGLAAGRIPRGQRARIAAETLERFGLSALADQPARLLSGGDQQSLAIARAAALAPDVLLLDEPTAHLDPGATRELEVLLTSLADEGTTILFSTHDFAQARRLAARAMVLIAGDVADDGPLARVMSSPNGLAVQAFLKGDLLW
jgi:tungstate transport system ATP-binding protein